MIHELKTDPEFFDAILDGRKTFEVRLNDRGYQVGDVLILKEYDRAAARFSGISVERRVVYMTSEFQGDGYVVLGIKA